MTLEDLNQDQLLSYYTAIESGLPTYLEVIEGKPETEGRLLQDAISYCNKYPLSNGYECWTPEYGIKLVRPRPWIWSEALVS